MDGESHPPTEKAGTCRQSSGRAVVRRAEMEKRLRTVEAKINFIMHTLALTRTNTQTGKVDSRTMDSLFGEAVQREVDAETVATMAEGPQPGPSPQTAPSNPSEFERQGHNAGNTANGDEVPHG